MPRGNKMGPQGLGSRTGRALGYCTGKGSPGFVNASGFGRGRGAGQFQGGFAMNRRASWGRGNRGSNRRWNDFSDNELLTQQEQMAILKNQAEHYESVLDALNQQMAQLKNQKPEGAEEQS